jgi:hypothetical protein
MIMHVAPRCVSVVSHFKGASLVQQLFLDTVLGVDLSDDKPNELTLVVDLLGGKRIVAGRYRDPAKAGADFGKLRILLGLPAWPEEWQQSGANAASSTEAADPSAWCATPRAIAIICTTAAVMVCAAISLTG